MSKKIALLGGAFNPIHEGHLYLAKQFQSRFPDITLCFVPSGASAHKSNLDLASNEDRLAMLQLALEDSSLSSFFISDIELSRKGTSYTIETVRALKSSYGNECDFFVLIGDDLIEGLSQWKCFDQLRQEVTFVVAYRENFPPKEIEKIKATYREFLFLENPCKELSSTLIRERIAIGAASPSVPNRRVLDYIEKKGLYSANQIGSDRKGAFAYMQAHLSPSRLGHCYRVAKEASRLASLYRFSALAAYQAGFFHDIARSMELSQMVALGKRYQKNLQNQVNTQLESDRDFPMDYDEDQLILYHAQAGALLLQKQFGFSDPDFLEAVACHSCGKRGMGTLAQLVFVADFTEPGRNFDNQYWYQLAGRVPLPQLVLEVAKAAVDFDKKAGRKTIPALRDLVLHLQQELKIEMV